MSLNQDPSQRKTPRTQLPIDLNHELSAGFAHRYIRFKVHQLVGRRIRKSERDDLEQELKIRVFQAFPSFDPGVADWDVYVTTIVERQIATLLEARRRQKRQGELTVDSLADEATDCDGQVCELADTVSLEDVARHTGQHEMSDLDRMIFEHDLETVIGQLSEKDQAICRALQRHSIQQAARKLKMPRTTVQSVALRLRGLLEEKGFRDFL